MKTLMAVENASILTPSFNAPFAMVVPQKTYQNAYCGLAKSFMDEVNRFLRVALVSKFAEKLTGSYGDKVCYIHRACNVAFPTIVRKL